MDNAKQQLVEKLKNSSNVLVTVSRNPSVDQLAALLGLSLTLNKQGKHCAAVFSGTIPSTIEFLKPEETIETTTDSLRDFIIALDKSKADKLRYKVEDNIVRIFITPYKTSISEADLEFSQGDFNVDVVIALGVNQQSDLDEAITNHGRILHDATVASISTVTTGDLGSINWHDQAASSLSELVTELAVALGKDLLDQQIATALLTGIVSETNRFSNDKTSAQTMNISSQLMAAGANQQLIATKLEESAASSSSETGQKSTPNGTLEINHEDKGPLEGETGQPAGLSNAAEANPANDMTLPPVDETPPDKETPDAINLSSSSKLITEPPALGGELTANTQLENLDPTTDPMSMPQVDQPELLDHKASTLSSDTSPTNATISSQPPVPSSSVSDKSPSAPTRARGADTASAVPFSWSPTPTPTSTTPMQPSPVSPQPEPTQPLSQPEPNEPSEPPEPPQIHVDDNGTLTQIEEAVKSPHVGQNVPDTELARNEVDKALSSLPPADNSSSTPLSPSVSEPPAPSDTTDPSSPPPVPPPIPFQFNTPS